MQRVVGTTKPCYLHDNIIGHYSSMSQGPGHLRAKAAPDASLGKRAGLRQTGHPALNVSQLMMQITVQCPLNRWGNPSLSTDRYKV